MYELALQQVGEPAKGLLAVPDGSPKAIVVVAHGWQGSARMHERDLETLALRGAVAVAMEFRGPEHAFKVEAGVADSLVATAFLQQEFPMAPVTMLFGWSMGGEVALLAAARAPPATFDYVFAGAGVMDLEALWHEAPHARHAIEEEAGGPPANVPEQYASRSPLRQVAALADSRLRRVFLVHGAADYPVPVEHSERMYTALQEHGVPTSFYVVTKDRQALCLPTGWCPNPTLPAGHMAGEMRLMLPFISNRLEGRPDPVEAAVRGTYDGETGEYSPPDTR